MPAHFLTTLDDHYGVFNSVHDFELEATDHARVDSKSGCCKRVSQGTG
jgi:hypothetical protein